jgi:hypothetical protein
MTDCATLAKRYARQLPPQGAVDWEDIRQELELSLLLHPTESSPYYAASDLIRKERVRAKPIETKVDRAYRPTLPVIAECAGIIRKWPWTIGLMIEDSPRQIAIKAGINPTSITERIHRIRKRIR